MAELYLDNDVSLRIVPNLEEAGHWVMTTPALDLTTASDDAQLLTAAQHRWLLITHNRHDFVMLHDAWLSWPAAFGLSFPPHPGIIVRDHASVEIQASALIGLLASVRPTDLANKLF